MRLKRVVRYLQEKPRAVQLFKWAAEEKEVKVQVDSDWAGCLVTRRSTSGGVLLKGPHVLGHWSRTQPTVALSSGEAEVNAALKGGCEILSVKELLEQWARG